MENRENAYVRRAVEEVVLGLLPLVGNATQLHAVGQVQRVVVRVDGNVVSEELVHLLHQRVLVRLRQLLDVVDAADVREV